MSHKKKKVLILLPGFDLGGAEKQALYIARSMVKSGQYEVKVAALEKGSGKLIPFLEDPRIGYSILNIPFSSFRGRKTRIIAYLKFLKYLVRGSFDVIIPYTYHCNVMAASTYRFAFIKTCLWFQIAMEYHLPYSFFEKLARFFRPVYAANSQAAADFIANKHQLKNRPVKIIPNPFERIPAKYSDQYWKEKTGKKEGDLIFVMSANFFPEKDHETVIKAVSRLGIEYARLKFVFAGGPLNNFHIYYLKSLVLDLQLMDQIHFIGTTDDIPGLLSVADFGLLSSVSEGSPNSVIEYMGYGLPVIATSIPPIMELLGQDYPYFFETGNAEDCARCIKKIVAEKNDLSLSVMKNKEVVQNTYSVANNLTQFDSLIQPKSENTAS